MAVHQSVRYEISASLSNTIYLSHGGEESIYLESLNLDKDLKHRLMFICLLFYQNSDKEV